MFFLVLARPFLLRFAIGIFPPKQKTALELRRLSRVGDMTRL